MHTDVKEVLAIRIATGLIPVFEFGKRTAQVVIQILPGRVNHQQLPSLVMQFCFSLQADLSFFCPAQSPYLVSCLQFRKRSLVTVTEGSLVLYPCVRLFCLACAHNAIESDAFLNFYK